MGKLLISFVLCLAMASPALAQSTSTKSKASASTGASLKSDEFSTEAAAKGHCPGDTVVWATLSRAHAYHLSSDRYYGKTKRGAYMCQKDADRAGMHQAGRRTASSSTSKKSTTSTTH
jgi:hypothetical protein